MPFWDMLAPNVLRNNRWRCDHGWDIDLDDGSSGYLIYNNLLLNGGLKLREGYKRTATNNVIINSSLHPHVWYRGSGDVFRNNIVFKPYQPAIMNSGIPADGKWGKELDYNFFVTNKKAMERFAANGCDLHSINGDPMFVNAAAGDYRVSDNSPVLQVGFTNFPMDQFGVMKPSLKAIAKTPVVPAVSLNIEEPDNTISKPAVFWMGIALKEPVGNELSAFGVSFEAGGVALGVVSENSKAAQLGFRTGDLIQQVNESRIRTIQNLKVYIDESIGRKEQKHVFRVIRNQQPLAITITQPLQEIVVVGK
jgi:hypothetical protein